jgi:hypothetical protein
MTINYTTLLGLAQPVTGTEANTWGTAVNDQITGLLDTAVAGTTTLSSDADVTLTTTAGAANTSRQAVILWTASGTVTRNITAPAQSKTYMVINSTGSTQSIVLRGAGPTTGITVVAGEKCVAAWNGSDFVKIASSVADGVTTITFGSTGLTPSTATSGAVSVAGTLAVANGGTGVTSSTGTGAVVLGTDPTLSLPVINNVKMGFTSTATAAGTTTLTASSNHYQRFTGTTTQTIVLPVTSTLAAGLTYAIENASTGNLTVNSSGGNLVVTVIPGVTVQCMCIGTTLTTAADWDPEYNEFAAVTGTGSVVLGTAPTVTNSFLTTIRETITISATAATGTVQFDASTQVILYYTTNASGNFTVNFRGTSSVTLDSVMSTGQSLSATFLVTNGATAYYNSVVQVDGSSVTPKWQGGSAPTSGNASSIDSYTYVLIKTGSATFTVLASVTKFA